MAGTLLLGVRTGFDVGRGPRFCACVLEISRGVCAAVLFYLGFTRNSKLLGFAVVNVGDFGVIAVFL